MTIESEADDLVPVFIPALVALLLRAEDLKGSPLTKSEVLAIRDGGTCIMMKAPDAQKWMTAADTVMSIRKTAGMIGKWFAGTWVANQISMLARVSSTYDQKPQNISKPF